MHMQMWGETAFISGAALDNGKAIALTFAREGAELVLIAGESAGLLREATAECEKMGAKTLTILADMTNREEVERTVQTGQKRFGKIAIAVSVLGVRRAQGHT